MRTGLISLAITAALTLALAGAAQAAPTTFTVNSTAGAADAAPGDGACATAAFVCTLRAAIEESNATGDGAPYRIAFAVTSISVGPDALPPITRSGTFVDGCGVGRTDPPFNTPNQPAAQACVGLIGTGASTGLQVGDASSGPSGVAIYNLALTNFPSRAIRLWGADASRIAGNSLGLRTSGLLEPNGTGIAVTGRTQDGALVNPAVGNLIGGPSSATDTDAPDCDAFCNVVVGSTQQGIDLVGLAAASGAGDAPAGTDAGLDEGTTITGNWIGVQTPTGGGAPNATAVKIGDALNTTFGTSPFSGGNVIAGNTRGIDQLTGTTSVTLLSGVFGLSPDRDSSRPNGPWNARLGGTDTPGGGPFIQGVTFGPADAGVQLNGPRANILGSVFTSPDEARFTTAAIQVRSGADKAFIGTNTTTFGQCIPYVDTCNTIDSTGPDAPGVLVEGADDVRIQRTVIGDLLGFALPVSGPPIRIENDAADAVIGDVDDDPNARNLLTRLTGPAIEVEPGSTGIVIGHNQGISVNGFGLPTGLFTDLVPAAGPGNSGTANNGIQAPVVTQSSINGIGGTGIPGATIRVLIQQRPPVPGDPDTYGEGYTFPPDAPNPSTATVAPDGIWGVAFPTPLKPGVTLLASQTTADGSSEYAGLKAGETSPPPLVTFQSGPSGVVGTRSATFTFSANRAGSRLECSVDAGAFVPCTSPFTLNGLDIGGHQLQVRATDPIGKTGPAASRTWIVVIDDPLNTSGGTPGGGTPSGSAAGTVRFSSVVSLPSAKRCVSRRTMRIRVRTPKGAKVRSAEVRIAGRKVGSARGARTITASLRGLPRGRFVVRVKVVLTDGRVIQGSRTYRTCAKRAKR